MLRGDARNDHRLNRMKFFNIRVLTCLLAVIAVVSVPGQALKITGAMWEDEVYPGDNASYDITIGLGSEEPAANFTIEVDGLYQSPEGLNLPVKGENDTSPYTAEPFLNASPLSFHLEPGGTQIVRVNADIPRDVGSGVRYGLLSLRNSGADLAKGKKKVSTVMVSIGSNIPVVLTIADTEMNMTGEITDLSLDKVDTKHQNISVIFKNTGNAHYKARLRADLINSSGFKVADAETPVSFSSIVPTFSRLFKVSINPSKPLKRGSYTLKTYVEMGDGTVLASRETQIKL